MESLNLDQPLALTAVLIFLAIAVPVIGFGIYIGRADDRRMREERKARERERDDPWR